MHILPLAIKRAIAQQGGVYVLDDLALHLTAPDVKNMQKVCIRETGSRSLCEIALKIIQGIIDQIAIGMLRACSKAKATGLTSESVEWNKNEITVKMSA